MKRYAPWLTLLALAAMAFASICCLNARAQVSTYIITTVDPGVKERLNSLANLVTTALNDGRLTGRQADRLRYSLEWIGRRHDSLAASGKVLTWPERQRLMADLDLVQSRLVQWAGGEIALGLRSDYQSRLKHIMEQIALAEQNGWLTPTRALHLKHEHAKTLSLVSTLSRSLPVTQQKTDLLERAVNQLALQVNRSLDASRVAGRQWLWH